MKNRSSSYIFTADPSSEEGQFQIEIVRKTVEISNKIAQRQAKYLGIKPVLSRVCVKGRLGVDNPNAQIYRDKVTFWGRKGDYQSIKLAHAQRVDVYVYTR